MTIVGFRDNPSLVDDGDDPSRLSEELLVETAGSSSNMVVGFALAVKAVEVGLGGELLERVAPVSAAAAVEVVVEVPLL